MPMTILLAEDEASQRVTLAAMLAQQLGCEVVEAEDGHTAMRTLLRDEQPIDLAILDISMPGMSGLEVLEMVQQRFPHLPVIMHSAHTETGMAVQAMKAGAVDFIMKPADPTHVGVTVKNALKMSALNREVTRLTRREEGQLRFEDLIGHDRGLVEATIVGRKAAASDIPVLIIGETGVGKELFARAIHGESPRAGQPFIAVNCGAIPEKLVESTLFGHEKGAFTGATAKTLGKFREADGGTIFLDEVGELPMDVQVKLLRVLQQKEVEPVGAGKPQPIDVRILSATHRQLAQEVQQGHFREDLYFRLHVLSLYVPPLRERPEDIVPLATHFIQRFSSTERRPVIGLSDEAEAQLTHYDWPGNVRELENTVQRAVVMSDAPMLEAQDFAFVRMSSFEETDKGGHAAMGAHIRLQDEDGQWKTMDTIEQEAMEQTLKRHRGNVTQAAKSLGMAKSTFYRKLNQR